MKIAMISLNLFMFVFLTTLKGFTQEKEKITITGKVSRKGTNKPPIGIITIAEKGEVDYWAAGDNVGTNHHTFVEKDGSFKFTINKGGTIVIQDGANRYRPLTLTDLKVSQTLDLVLERTLRTSPPAYPENELLPHEKIIDIHKRISISGKITFPDGKEMQNATVGQLDVYTAQTHGSYAHTTSGENGIYEYTVMKGGRISFGAIGYARQTFTATKDTVINVRMLRANPFDYPHKKKLF